MELREAMARRYCIIRREDPDEILDGRPIWEHAVDDINAVFLMLDTMGIDDPTSSLFEGKRNEIQLAMDFDNRHNVVAIAGK